MDLVFYHLTITPLLRGLPKLVSKMFDAGQRVFILCKDAQQLSELDTLLWTFSQKEFIPHDTMGCQNPELQPVLLGTTLSDVNQADVVVILNGLSIQTASKNGSRLTADLGPSATLMARLASVRDDNVVGDFSKYVYVFYGNKDDIEVKALCKMCEDYKRKGINPIFWHQQDDGKWARVNSSTVPGSCSQGL